MRCGERILWIWERNRSDLMAGVVRFCPAWDLSVSTPETFLVALEVDEKRVRPHPVPRLLVVALTKRSNVQSGPSFEFASGFGNVFPLGRTGDDDCRAMACAASGWLRVSSVAEVLHRQAQDVLDVLYRVGIGDLEVASRRGPSRDRCFGAPDLLLPGRLKPTRLCLDPSEGARHAAVHA